MDRTALITGTDKGLGKYLLNTFLVHGYRVYAGRYQESTKYNDSRNIGGEALNVIPLDVSDPESVRAAAAAVSETAEAIDLIINNAGIIHSHHDAPLEEVDIEEIPQVLNVNALGPLRIVKAFLPLLRKGSGKMIINISSEAGRIEECKYTDRVGYCMSKTAVNIQSKVLQNALGEEGIKIIAVHPGWMQTDMGGTGADVPPIESARGVYDLSQRSWGADDPIYMDYTGKVMAW